MGAHGVHDPEGIGRVAEVSEIAREDGAVGFAQCRAELLDGPKGHVNVTEADQSHLRVCNRRTGSLQRGVRSPSVSEEPTTMEQPSAGVRGLLPSSGRAASPGEM